jgi:hypothetical protein
MTMRIVGACILVISLILLALVLSGHAQEVGSSQYGNQFPAAPEPVKPLPHGAWQHDPPRLKTFTRTWVIAHSVFAASIVYDAEVTHTGIAHHKCVEQNSDLPRHPSRGELYRDSALPFAVMTGFDLLVQSRHLPKGAAWIGYIGAIYGTGIHAGYGSTWFGAGCW